MKLKLILISGSAAFALLLASCGEGDSSAENTEDAQALSSASEEAYPLDVCVVSGEKLGSMGEPVVINHEGTEVRFCCKSCKPDFEADPDKYVAMVKAGKAQSSNHSDHKNH